MRLRSGLAVGPLAASWLAVTACTPADDAPADTDTADASDPVDTDESDSPVDTDESDDTDEALDPALAALLAGAVPWGPVGAELPPDAVLVDPPALVAWAAGLEVRGIDPTTRSARTADVAARLAADRALLDDVFAANPEIAARFPDGAPPAGEVLEDGTVRATLGATGTTVILDPAEVAVADLAASLRAAEDPFNLRAIYADLIALLPGDQVDGLVPPAELAGVTDVSVLTDHLEAVTERTQEVRPGRWTAEDAFAIGEAGGPVAEDLGCGAVSIPADEVLLDLVPLALRPFLPPLRDQGNRGTCGAFAAVGGLELATWRTFGREVDLSEQDLYAYAKGDWQPSPNDLGDGLVLSWLHDELLDQGFRVQPEGVWPYNRAPSRVLTVSGATAKYANSCEAYPHTCSNTNHQRDTQCAVVNGSTWCFQGSPRAQVGPNVVSVGLTGRKKLWNAAQPGMALNAIAAYARAGVPVVIGVHVDDQLKDLEWESPFLEYPFDDLTDSNHFMVVVGHVDALEMMPLVASGAVPPSRCCGQRRWPDENDLAQDWFVIRNSWGCEWGQFGYAYASRAWLAERLYTAEAVWALAPTLHSVTLSASASQVTTPTVVRFDVDDSGPVQTVELYRAGQLVSVDPAGPFVFDITVDEAYNGAAGWYVVGKDAAGTPVMSNVVQLAVAIVDTGPSVTVAAPAAATAPSTLDVTVTAADSDGVDRVELWRGGRGFAKLGTDNTAPYTFRVLLTDEDVGRDVPLFAFAWDDGGKLGTSATVRVGVTADTDGPSIVVVAPEEADAPGTLTLQAVVSDPAGVENVIFRRGTTVLGADRTPPYEVDVPLGLDDVGRTIYGVEAVDRVGNSNLVLRAVDVVLGGPPGEVLAFTASRTRLSPLGGTVTLDWVTTPEATLTLTDVGDVSGETGWVLDLPPNPGATAVTYEVELTAETLWGSQSASVSIVVDPLPAGWLVVDPVGGNDTSGNGSLAAPLLHVHTAVGRLAADGGLLLAPGSHRMLGRLDLPAGTEVRAADPGAVTLVPWIVNQSSGWFRALGDATFDGFACASGGPCLETEAGSVRVVDVQGRANTCGGGGNSALVTVAGTAQVALVATSDDHRWLDGAGAACLLRLSSGTAAATLTGGRVTSVPTSGVSGEAVLYLGSGTLAVEGVVFEDVAPGVLAAWGGVATLRDVEVRRVLSGVVGQVIGAYGGASVTIEDSLVESIPSRNGVLLAGGTPSVTLRRTTFSGLASGMSTSFLFGAITPTVRLEDSVIRGSVGTGINLDAGSLTLLGSQVHSSGQMGVAAAVTTLRLRDSAVFGNGEEGIRLSTASAVSWDLGRGDDPGDNVLSGNGSQNGGANVAVLAMPTGGVLYAAGNTWTANEQGTGGDGRYGLGEGQVIRDVTDATSAGRNYRKPAAGTIRLAEDACVPAGTCP